MEKYKIFSKNGIRRFVSQGVNFIFNEKNGHTMVWGNSIEDNPDYLPYGPMIADIEITTKCSGPGGKLCPFCYKGNTPNGHNMSFETFKQVFDKLPATLTQIAFGADATLTANPDIWKIMEYCKNNGNNYVVPNVTVADVSDEVADKLSVTCGAVAVSRYADKDICYNSVKKLTDRGMEQVNIHYMISEQTFEGALETLQDIVSDDRLKGLNAIVFLSLKQKGRGLHFTPLSQDKFKQLIDFATSLNVRYGFDSCSAVKFLKAVADYPNYKQLEMMAEPCESTRFSTYVNVFGDFFPCSFAEGHGDWKEGFSVVTCENFVDDIWNHPKTTSFRASCVNNLHDKISCSLFEV